MEVVLIFFGVLAIIVGICWLVVHCWLKEIESTDVEDKKKKEEQEK